MTKKPPQKKRFAVFYDQEIRNFLQVGMARVIVEINNDYLQLTNSDNPHQVIAQLSLEDL